MQLIYRGIPYQPTITDLTTIEQKINFKYRGVSYQLLKPKAKMITDICVLKYQGVEFIKVLNH